MLAPPPTHTHTILTKTLGRLTESYGSTEALLRKAAVDIYSWASIYITVKKFFCQKMMKYFNAIDDSNKSSSKNSP